MVPKVCMMFPLALTTGKRNRGQIAFSKDTNEQKVGEIQEI
jgi:hypothetical protein